MKMPGCLQKRLSIKPAIFGLLQLHPGAALAGLAGQCGYDFLVLDEEHGSLGEEDFREALGTLATSTAMGFVRLSAHDARAFRLYLSMGADGIVVPHVSTAAEVKALVRAAGADNEASLVVIIESRRGVSNAEEILRAEEVDGALVGPIDLTDDLGCKGDFAHPAYQEALSRIEQAATAAGVPLGTIPHGRFSLDILRARGHRLFLLGTDHSLMREAMQAQLIEARASFGC